MHSRPACTAHLSATAHSREPLLLPTFPGAKPCKRNGVMTISADDVKSPMRAQHSARSAPLLSGHVHATAAGPCRAQAAKPRVHPRQTAEPPYNMRPQRVITCTFYGICVAPVIREAVWRAARSHPHARSSAAWAPDLTSCNDDYNGERLRLATSLTFILA